MSGPVSIQLRLVANACLTELSDLNLEPSRLLGQVCRVDYGLCLLFGGSISADRGGRPLENPLLDPRELAVLRIQFGLGTGDSRHHHVEIMARVVSSQECRFQLRRTDATLGAAPGTDVISIDWTLVCHAGGGLGRPLFDNKSCYSCGGTRAFAARSKACATCNNRPS